ncbi:hypothetical protein Tco_0993953, partial [Tanacetum coccineum]
DLLVPPNKQYGLAEANNNIDLVNPLCPPSSKILGNILTQHPLCFALTAFASVSWIYIQQVWHTLGLDDSKEMFIFFTNTKEFTFSVDDFRRVFQLPQATDINHAGFVEPPTSFSFSSDALPLLLCNLVTSLQHTNSSSCRNNFAYKGLISIVANTRENFLRMLNYKSCETPSAPRPPNLVEHQGESSALRKHTLIMIQKRSQPNPETPTPTPAEIDVTNVDKATQMIIATARSLEDLEARQNVKRVKEHMVDEEIGKIVEGNDDVNENQFVDDILNSQEYPGTKIEPEKDEESAADALRRKKGKGVEDIKDTPPTTTPRSPRTHTDSLSSNKEELKELTASEPSSFSPKPKTDCFKH